MMLYRLFLTTESQQSTRLHPAAAASLKIIDVLRIATLTLGVFSFDPELTVHLDATWAAAHEYINSQVQPECCFKSLENKRVIDYKGRTLWIALNGKPHRAFYSFVRGET